MDIKKHSNGVYYAHFKGEAGPQEISLRTGDRAEAKRLAAEAKIEELERAAQVKALTAETIQRITSGGKVSNEQALAEWRQWSKTVGISPMTVRSYDRLIFKFLVDRKLLKRPPSAATVEMIDGYINTSEDIKAATRSARRNALNTFFTFCVARGHRADNPVSLTRLKYHMMTHAQKEPKTRQPFTESELKTLQQVDDTFWRVAIALGSEFGLRLSDVALLEWASLSKPGKIIIWTDKHDVRLEFDLPAALERILAKVEKTDRRFVFPEQAATFQSDSLRAKLSVYFGRVLGRQGIEGKSFHSLRHSFATRHAKLGESVDEIRRKLGHALPETTAGYIHS